MMDKSAQFIVASCTDKFVTIRDTVNGNLIVKATCGELTTGMCFSADSRYLITASSDGSIYFWRLPE